MNGHDSKWVGVAVKWMGVVLPGKGLDEDVYKKTKLIN